MTTENTTAPSLKPISAQYLGCQQFDGKTYHIYDVYVGDRCMNRVSHNKPPPHQGDEKLWLELYASLISKVEALNDD